MICMPSPTPIFFMRLANSSGGGSMCGSGEDLSSMSKKIAPGMCCAKYSALALRLVVGKCMDPSSTTSAGACRCPASQSVSTSHLWASSAIALPLFSSWPFLRSQVVVPASSFLLSCERDADTAVELALLFDLGDRDLTDLARALHVRATARLQVDRAVLADDDEAYTARA